NLGNLEARSAWFPKVLSAAATNQRRKAFPSEGIKKRSLSEGINMKLKLIALASAAMIGLTAVAIPNQAEARWRGGGWWIPGAVIGGAFFRGVPAKTFFFFSGEFMHAYCSAPHLRFDYCWGGYHFCGGLFF